ncbi:MAG: DUF1697 domain-containing protein [Actinomycetota bacterium]|nr:DUF1697 domain-containing protein [Actinomycetota bacterium]
MTRAVALIRGVNVGGRSMLPMAELRAALSKRGFGDAQTYLQSGNVVLEPGTVRLPDLAAALEAAIAEDFGLEVRVMTRTRKELVAVAGAHPFRGDHFDPSLLHVVFLEKAPAAAKLAVLDPDRSPPDRFEVHGREIYLSYPNGQGRSKLNLDYFERVLGTAGTARNWNTVTKLLEMVR